MASIVALNLKEHYGAQRLRPAWFSACSNGTSDVGKVASGDALQHAGQTSPLGSHLKSPLVACPCKSPMCLYALQDSERVFAQRWEYRTDDSKLI